MRHYRAYRRKDGRWDYTVQSRLGVLPAGYCCAAPDTSKEVLPGLPWRPEEKAAIEANRAKYHTDGHETQEEAEACYKEYVLDRLSLKRIDFPVCAECGQPAECELFFTRHVAGPFCKEHATREIAAKHFSVSENWES